RVECPERRETSWLVDRVRWIRRRHIRILEDDGGIFARVCASWIILAPSVCLDVTVRVLPLGKHREHHCLLCFVLPLERDRIFFDKADFPFQCLYRDVSG